MEDSDIPKHSDSLKLELSQLHSPLRVGQWYSLTATVKKGGIPTYYPGVIKVEAFQEDNKEPHELTLRDEIKLEADGNASIVFKLSEPTKVVESKPKKNIIRVTLYDGKEPNSKPIVFADANPVIVFKFGLKVIEAHSAPYIFYKDKGGKDQGIELDIRLVDETDNLVTDKDILLMPVLLYEGGVKVSDQTILTMSNDKTALRLSQGKTCLKFRINQVSTKHCNQKFCILITQACREHDFPEVAPAISIPVDVRSKKNKRPSQTGGLLGLSSMSNDTDMMNPNKKARILNSESRSTIMFESELSPSAILNPIITHGDTYSASIKVIEDWIKETMMKMKDEIRWKQSGINRDTGEPLYEIRNPNNVIDRLLGSYDRIAAALTTMGRLRHMLEACANNPALATVGMKYPSVKIENNSASNELSPTPNIKQEMGGSGIITSLSSSLDICTNQAKFLKPDALFANMRTESGETLESHAHSVLTERSDHDEIHDGVPSKSESRDISVSGIALTTPDGKGYDMLDMLATVANRNGKELLKPDQAPSSSGKNISTFIFENPLPDQVANDNLNVTLIVTEYVTVDNVIQGFPGFKFDANGNLELLGFYKVITDKINTSNFDENRIKEIGPTNSVVISNNYLRQIFAKEDNAEGQLCAVMDVIIKKEQTHDVRIELWRYYHDTRPFQQPKVLHDKKLALKFQVWTPASFPEIKKQKIEKFASSKINSTVALVKQKANTADILAKTAQRLVTCNVFSLTI